MQKTKQWVALVLSVIMILSMFPQLSMITSLANESQNLRNINVDFSTLKTSHPRIFTQDFNEIKTKIETYPEIGGWYQNVIRAAENYMTIPAEASQGLIRQKDIAMKLSMAYKISGDERYAIRLWEELSLYNADNFNDSQLVRSITAIGFAVAYDWLYDYWTVEQKDFLKNFIKDVLLKTYNDDYNLGGPIYNGSRIANFNQIVNGAIIVAALAIADEEPATSKEVVDKAINNISFDLYSINGANPEGTAYASFASVYVTYCLSALETALGNDYGLSQESSIERVGEFFMSSSGPDKSFAVKYGDNHGRDEFISYLR